MIQRRRIRERRPRDIRLQASDRRGACRSAAGRPGGFSLLELLIVVAIIGILLAFSVGQVGQMIRRAKEKSTAATILKIDGLLEERRQAFGRAMDSTRSPERNRLRKTFNSPAPAGSARLQEILFDKYLMQTYFSPHFPTPGDPTSFPGDTGSGDLTEHRADTESAEMLYYLLTQAEVFGVSPVAGDEFSTSEVADTDGDGLLEFIDAWGQPLRFYLFPTRLIRPAGPGSPVTAARVEVASLLISSLPQDLEKDQDDGLGTVSLEWGTLSAPDVEMVFRTPDTFHTPLIVSAGADGQLGLFEPGDKANYGHLAMISLGPDEQPGVAGEDDDGNGTVDDVTELALPGSDEFDALSDNITNHNQRAGG